ncbi:TPA: hypothetical protein ACLG1R_003244 [Pseudomonas aeruginosa]
MSTASAQDNQESGIIALAILIALAIFLFWHYADRILGLWQILIVPVARFVAWFASTDIGGELAKLLKQDPKTLARIPEYVGHLSPEQLKQLGFGGAKRYGDYVHRWTTLVVGPLMIFTGWRLMKHRDQSGAVFGVIEGVPALAKKLSEGSGREWMKQVKDLTKVAMFDGPIGQQAPITPWRWAEIYKLAKTDEQRQLVELDHERTRRTYLKTLGRRFTSIEALQKGPNGWIWNELMKQVRDDERKSVADYAIRGHLYEKTVIITLLRGMTTTMIVNFGPLQPLRHKDLAFFDAICSVGRRTCFASASGILGQYRYEVEMLRASKGKIAPEPGRGVEWAVAWLEEALRTDPYEQPWFESDDIWLDFDPML